MYRYDEFDHGFVAERAAQFRDQVARRLAGDLTEEQFKPLRLQNGLYLQLHAYMLRVAIPYGVLSARQLRQLAAHRAQVGSRLRPLHHAPEHPVQLDQARGRAGHPRRAGRGRDARHPDQRQLHPQRHRRPLRRRRPRRDRGPARVGRGAAPVVDDPSGVHVPAAQVQDRHHRRRRGSRGDPVPRHRPEDRQGRRTATTGFRVYVGGGQGRTPYVAQEIARVRAARRDLLSYLEAIMRVYNLHGRRDNIYKARIKILVNALGIDEFRRQVEAEWATLDKPSIDLPAERAGAHRRALRAAAAEAARRSSDADIEARRKADAGFDRWLRTNVLAAPRAGPRHRQHLAQGAGQGPGRRHRRADGGGRRPRRAVRPRRDPRHLSAEPRAADRRASPISPQVYDGLVAADLETANTELITDIIACPGLDYCNLANARSIGIAQEIATRFADPDKAEAIGPLRLNISGCINACGHHHAGNIGILGVDKKGTEHYQITLGGSPKDDAEIGDIVGPSFTAEAVPGAIETIVETYLQLRRDPVRDLRRGLPPARQDAVPRRALRRRRRPPRRARRPRRPPMSEPTPLLAPLKPRGRRGRGSGTASGFVADAWRVDRRRCAAADRRARHPLARTLAGRAGGACRRSACRSASWSQPAETLDPATDDIARLAVIALVFPKFTRRPRLFDRAAPAGGAGYQGRNPRHRRRAARPAAADAALRLRRLRDHRRRDHPRAGQAAGARRVPGLSGGL